MVRTTLEALSAVLGGGQSLHTNALDEAIGLPTEASARLALRTQQILAEESGATSTVDPLGGAYAIEELTDRIEREAVDYLERVEAMGGALVAVEKGYFASEIAREAYRVALAREAGTELVVGVNTLREGNPEFSLFSRKGGVRGERIGAAEEARQIARVRKWRQSRNAADVAKALTELERSTGAGENVVPAVIAAVKHGATLGEISDVWRRRFGEQRPSTAF